MRNLVFAAFAEKAGNNLLFACRAKLGGKDVRLAHSDTLVMRLEKAPEAVCSAVCVAFEILLGLYLVLFHEILHRSIFFAKPVSCRKHVFPAVFLNAVGFRVCGNAVKVIGEKSL